MPLFMIKQQEFNQQAIMATVAEVQMVQPVVESIKVGVLPFIMVVLVIQDIYSKVDEDD